MRNFRKLLALVLAVCMLLSSQSVTLWASSLSLEEAGLIDESLAREAAAMSDQQDEAFVQEEAVPSDENSVDIETALVEEDAGQEEVLVGEDAAPEETLVGEEGIIPEGEITVEDAGIEEEELVGASSQNLADYLTGVSITGSPINPDTGNNVVKPNQEYGVELNFAETEDMQFPEDNLTMTYTLPAGLTADAQNGELSIDVSYYDGSVHTVYGNKYSIDPDTNTLTYTWNNEDPNYSKLTEASNAEFHISFKGKFDGSQTSLNFGHGIVKTVELDDTHDLTISKNGYIDNNGEVPLVCFESVINSTGTNHNIVVEDNMSGTAFKYQRDAKIEGLYSSEASINSSDNGFTCSIPFMADGENAKITYTAVLDTSMLNIQQDGGELTAGETSNTISVKSDEKPDGSQAYKDFEHTSYASFQGKTAKSSEDGSYVTWTLNLNEEMIASIGGTSIKDKIKEDSQGKVEYSGEGLTINKTDRSGNTTSVVVPWSEVGMTGTGDYDWEYTFPASDGAVKYEIVYTTASQVGDTLQSVSVGNAATHSVFGGRETYGSVGGPGSNFPLTISKQATSVDSSEIEWKVNAKIPKGREYASVFIEDTLPSVWASDKNLYDALIPESVIIDGLTEGYYAIDTNAEDKFIITFYKDANHTVEGLPYSDADRNLTITFKTSVNQEWFNDTNLNKSHSNNIKINVDGVEKSDSDEAVPVKASVEKKGSASGSKTIDGVDCPVYKYEVLIGGVNEGTLTIDDEFDTEILSVYDNTEQWENLYAFGGNQYSQSNRGPEPGIYESTDKGARFTVSVPKNNLGNYYSYYKFVYYLVVKDGEALQKLRSRAAASNFTAVLGNKATYGGESSNEANVTYQYKPLEKALLNGNELGAKNRIAKYSITINPGSVTLNHGDDIEVKDTFSENLNILYDTIAFDNPDAVVTYNVSGHEAVYIIKDATPVTITYSATILGTGTQTISNRAEMCGQSSSSTDSREYSTQGGGTASVAQIKVLKQETGKMDKRLEGVVFALYDGKTNQQMTSDGQPVTFTTDENGMFTVKSEPGPGKLKINFDHRYYLKEISTRPGYELSTIDWTFTITTDPKKVDTNNYVYPQDYTMRISNDLKTAGIVLNKGFGGDLTADKLTDDQKAQIVFTVKKLAGENPEEEPEEIIKTVSYSEFTGGTYTINKLYPGNYVVTETAPQIEGYNLVTSYNVDGGTAGEGQATVTITTDDAANANQHTVNVSNDYKSTKTSASVTKNWIDDENKDGLRPDSIQVELVKGKEDTEPTTALKTVTLNEENDWSYTESDLKAKEDNGDEIFYRWREVGLPTGYSMEASTNQNEAGAFFTTISNTHVYEETTSTVTKVWDDGDNADGLRPGSITVTFEKTVEGSSPSVMESVTLDDSNGWTCTKDHLPLWEDGKRVTYSWGEPSVPDKYSMSLTTTQSEETKAFDTTITNKHEVKTTERSVKKEWNDEGNTVGTHPDSLDVTLYGSDGSVRTVTLKDENQWSAKIDGLPIYSGGQEIAYTWTENLPEDCDYVKVSQEEVDGVTTIGNKYAPDTTSVSVIKNWDDANNQDGKRPDSIKMTLSRTVNGQTTTVDTVTLSEENNWTATVDNLPKKAAGQDIVYKWSEEPVDGYDSTEETVEGTTTFTNKYVPEVTERSIQKEWNDNDNQDRKRPGSLVVNLMKGDDVYKTVTLYAEDGWKATVDNLPKYEKGVEISYSWEEASIPEGYELENNASNGTLTTLTNKYTPETKELKVAKVWEDANDQDGKRPATITAKLTDGSKEWEVILSESNSWAGTVSNLPVYKNGEEIEYTWSEEGLPEGYEMAKPSFDETTGITTLTNKHEVETTSLTVKKVWDDANDQDRKRQETLTVNLLADDVYKTSVTLSEGNGWEATVDNLPVYKEGEKGKEIKYTWSEGTLSEGYTMTGNTSEGTITTIINKYAPGTTSRTIQKVWDDDNNRDRIRPESITVTLSNNVNEKTWDVTLNAENGWSATVSDLPEKADGVDIVYTWSEPKVTGYTSTATSEGDVTTLTNTHETKKTSATVKKVWDDSDNQDGKRPIELTVVLSDGEKDVTTVTLNAINSWEATVENLPALKDGEEITYSWSEGTLPEGYELTDTKTEGTITTLTNSYKVETKELSVQKVWDDAEDQDGKRPKALKVNLLADGEEVKSVTLNEGNEWSGTIDNLPVYKNGKVIAYSWSEEGLPEGYSLAGMSVENAGITTITNKYAPGPTAVTVKKVWEDSDNQDGLRPSSITVTLSNDANDETMDVTLSEANGWIATISGLPEKAAGKTIAYSWSEPAVIGYTPEITTDEAGLTTITNTHVAETTEASVQKVWDDEENQDGARPDSLVVNLMNGSGKVTSVTLNAANNWTASAKDLPKYNKGEEIKYAWEEQSVPSGYVLGGTVTEGTLTTITNTHKTEETSVTVTKYWDDQDNADGFRPTSVDVVLVKGDDVANPIATATLSASNNWTYTKTGLPAKENGELIVYNWKELNVPTGYGMTSVTSGNSTSVSTTITNKHEVVKTEASVEKVWDDKKNQDGKRPDSLVVKLMNGDEEVGNVTLSEKNNWKDSIDNLPVYKDGVKINYEWVEGDMPEGYSLSGKSYSESADKSETVLTNTYAPGKTSATVKKVWDDANDQDGFRPDDITVELLANGVATGITATLNAENKWEATITDLDLKADGELILYTWEEEGVPAEYSQKSSQTTGTVTTLTNKHDTAGTEVSVTKVWDDADNQDGIRPDALEVNLLADGIATGKSVVLTEENKWYGEITGLPKYANGTEIKYTWDEGEVTGYIQSKSETSGTATMLTNRHVPEKTTLSVRKAWNDANNQDGKRPENITVKLKVGTEEKGEVTLNKDNSWAGSISDLPVYEDGRKIEYTWSEEGLPEGYALESSKTEGTVTTITNTYAPGKTSATVKKVWTDNNNQDGIRPESITVTLVKNGVATDQTVTLNEANGWTATLSDLQEMEDGNAISYTWSEPSVDGYTPTEPTIDGTTTTFTNTHETEETALTVVKEWNDADNQDGKRPGSISVILKADDEVKTTVTLSESNKWSATVEGLPVKNGGKAIAYSWSEEGLPEGYTLEATKTEGVVTTITNKYAPGMTSASVKKAWADNDNQDGIRPESITVTLLKNGVATDKTVILDAANNWTATITDLPEKEAGQTITYTWSEQSIEGYTFAGASVDEAGVTTLTNTHETEKTSVTVQKVWDDKENQDGKRPETLTVTLQADGVDKEDVTLSAENGWTKTIEDLPVKKAGTAIVYTWVEKETPAGYTLTGNVTEGSITTLTNKYQTETTELSVAKVWDDAGNQDGKRPATLTVVLKADGEEKGKVTLSEANNWSDSIKNLPVYKDGKAIKYSWSEEALPEGYTLSGETTEGTVTTITNRYAPGETSATVTKVWDDNNNQDGVRPASITVTLMKNGTATDQTVTLNADINWTVTISGLPEMEDGQPIAYSWSEQKIEGYKQTENTTDEAGVTTITNTHVTEKTAVSVKKVWDDADNQDGKRPASLTVELLKNGEATGETVELTESNGWSDEIADLDAKENGQAIAYSWREDEAALPEGYSLTNIATEGSVTTITNSYKAETVSKAIQKIWDDKGNRDNTRPVSLQVNLLKDGKTYETVVLSEENNWYKAFSNLPKYENGTEINYSWQEGTMPGGYSLSNTQEEGITTYLTNSYKAGSTAVKLGGTKTLKGYPSGAAAPTFVYVLTETTNGMNAELATATTEGPGTYSFKDIKYEEAGNHTYKVTEKIGNAVGVTYDDTEYTIAVKVEDDGTGQLKATTKVTGEIATTALNFENTYKARSVKAGFAAHKTLNGKALKANDFAFELATDSGESLQVKKNDADGNVAFDEIEYITAGTYTYKVKEVVPEKPESGMTYASEVYTAMVEVTDDGSGQLSAKVSYKNPDETTAATMEFSNTYKAGTTSVLFGGQKALKGISSSDETFRFALEEDGKLIQTAAVEGAGAYEFKSITYDKTGEHNYTVYEIPGNAAGYVYSDKTYDIKVVVTDDMAGQLTANVTGAKANGTGLDFTNICKIVKVSKIDATSYEEVEGATIQILDSDKNIVEEWKSGEEAHEVASLEIGETYTLKETVAPDGYTLTSETTFSIDAEGNVTSSGTKSFDENGSTVLLVKDTKTVVRVRKIDLANGKELEGATIQIINSKGEVEKEWVSTKEDHVVEGLIVGEVYTLKETVAPNGYFATSETTFVIDENGDVQTVGSITQDKNHNLVLLVEDEKTVVRVSKVDVADGSELEGAEIQILDSKGDIVREWTSTKKAQVIEGLTVGEEYRLKETVAPHGYTIASETTFTIGADGKVTTNGSVTKDKNGNTVLLVKDSLASVKVKKTDITGSEELEGATIQVLDADGGIVDQWTSTKEAHEVKDLIAGETYTLKETVAPNGYLVAAETTFVVDQNGNVETTGSKTTDENGKTVLLVKDAKPAVKVSKTAVGGEEELAGATIQILNKDGGLVEEWISTNEEHLVEGLSSGETYTLKETVAPEGYTIASETTFTIDEHGTVTSTGKLIFDEEGYAVLLIEDKLTSVKVSKVDVANGKELEGATIQLLDKNGDEVESWTSTKEAHEIVGLHTGEEYTLKETVAPEGYTIASETKFTIDAEGNVKSSGSQTKDENGVTVLLIEDAKTSITVTKVDVAGGEEVEGATIQIIDNEGNIVEEWTSTKEAHTVEGLKTGVEYTLHEEVAPNGYTVASDTTFVIEENGSVTFTGTKTDDGTMLVEDSKTSVRISKVDVADGAELEGAQMLIVKKVFEDGEEAGYEVVASWTSTKEVHVVEGLLTGVEYILREDVAPAGYAVATESTFTIGTNGTVITTANVTTDEAGNTVMLVEDELISVKIKKTDIATGEELEGAEIQILDSEGNFVEGWTSTKEAHEVTGLVPGVLYTLRETVAPEGYKVATETTFMLDDYGKVSQWGGKSEYDENGKEVLLLEDEMTSVKVKKTDIADGSELEGATIQLLDKNGNEVESWTSTKEAHEVKGLTAGEEYTLKETVAPAGYTVASETKFTVDENGNVTSSGTTTIDENGETVLLIEDAMTVVKVSKTDIASGEELEGATIQLLDKNGDEVESWTSTKEAHEIVGLKTGEEYTLKETVAPEGYQVTSETKFTIDENGNVTSTGTTTTDESGKTVLLIEDAKTSVKVSKTDVANGEELEGATIQILDSEGNEVETWTSTKEAHVIEGLKVGEEYTLKELVAPEGYTIATETTFTVDENNNVTTTGSKTTDENGNTVLLIEDAKTSITVTKVDVAGGEEVEGAKIQIIDDKGDVVEKWTSTKEAHKVEGLKTGVEYTLHEEVAPDGYTVATDTKFVIDEKGNVTFTGTTSSDGSMLVEDTKTSVRISKVDVADGEELEGAMIKILRKLSGEGEEDKYETAAQWTSTKEAHVVEGLLTGVEYVLHETVAPQGYTLASDTTFVIGTNGTVITTGSVTTDGEGNVVMLIEDSQTAIKVRKTDIASGEELEGATLQVIDKEGNEVETWTSTKEDHEITGLKTGEEYTLRETVAPEGYKVTTDTKFTIDANGNVTSSGSMTKDEKGETVLLVEDEKTSVKISKTDIASGEEIEGATIQILDSEGNVVEEWTSEEEAHEVVGLVTGEEYTLKEIVAPEGYTIASETTFTIDENGDVTSTGTTTKDENGETVLLVEDAKTSVRISKTDIADGSELAGATIQILDSEGNVVEEWISTTSAHEVEGLKVGEEYTLKETVAPEGYTVATETTFTIDENNNVTTTGTTTTDENGNTVILVEDAKTAIKVSKTDIANGEEIEGATIQILDSEGNVVEEWTSTKEAHEVEGLKTDEEYTLKETVAPEGYTIATETTFTIDAEGNVTSTGSQTKDESGKTVLLIEDAKTSITVTKVDVAGGEEVEGAKIQIIDNEGKVVEKWTSTKEAHTVEGLKTGVEYTLHEEVAPDGYVVATDTTFVIDEYGNVTFTGTKTEDGTMLVEDSKTTVRISKVDVADGAELEGAEMLIVKRVFDDGGNAGFEVVDSWTSTKEVHVVEGLLTGVEYILREDVAPAGYKVATESTFTIGTNGTVITTANVTTDEAGNTVMLVEDELTSVKVKKTDIATGEELEGAEIQIFDSEGNIFDSWTSTKEAHEVKGLKAFEEYTLKETVAPEGYTLASETKFALNEHGEVSYSTGTTTTDENGKDVLLVEDAMTAIKIRKTDIADGSELEGALLLITDSEDNVFETWISGEEDHEIKGLRTGEEYTLTEVTAPDGYTVTANTTFTIDEHGKVTSSGTVTTDANGEAVLLVEDARTVVNVRKTDIANGSELEGATIEIIDVNDTVVDTWVSTKEDHRIEGLRTGWEYTLKETVAPDGYAVTTETYFTIGEDGSVTTSGNMTTNENGEAVLLVEDKITSVKIRKTDIANGEELEGASIQILDSEDNIVEEWISTKEDHEVTGLLTNEQYRLVEVVAPEGYTIASETTFTISEDGKVTASGTTTTDEFGETVILIEDAKTSITVSKVEIAGSEEIEGAEIQILDEEGNIVESWTSTKEAHKVEGLKTGVEYTLHEEVAPNGYTIATDTTFVIDEHGNVTFTGTKSSDGAMLIEDAKTIVRISKVDVADGTELEGAQIQILRNISEEEGEEEYETVTEWTSTSEAHVVEGLLTGVEYILRETVAPEGYTLTSDTAFTITPAGTIVTDGTTIQDADGNTVMLVEDSKTKVKVSKVDVTGGQEVEGATIQIKDKDGKVVEEWTSGTEAHVIEGLKVGEEYTLVETVAPAGYLTTTETTFTINENGEVTYSGTTSEDGTLLVEDQLTSVRISKVDMETGWDIEGASMQIVDSKGNVVDEWLSDGSEHLVLGLHIGETYKLKEVAAPTGYVIAAESSFKLDADGQVVYKGTTGTDENEEVIMLVEDKPIHFHVTKISALTKESLAGATIVLYELTDNDRIVSDDGVTPKVIASWTSEKGKSYDFGPYLEAGKRYLLVESKAPTNYKRIASVIVTVTADGEINVSLEKQTDEEGNDVYVIADEASPGGGNTPGEGSDTNVTPKITPQGGNVTSTPAPGRIATVTPRTSTTTTTTTSTRTTTTAAASSTKSATSGTTTSKTTSAGTGDESPIAMYLILIAAASMVIAVTKKRRSSEG
ncbi:MAG: Cna B-type domain-containing protein [Lachnospiraceae bacterium]|nr:Cna B-type domain-containing protein [Lachnospiraceae bacterium]